MKFFDGGPAFPVIDGLETGDHGRQHVIGGSGMTLRDWFAGQALIGLITSTETFLEAKDVAARAGVGREVVLANWAYDQADLMLAERRLEIPDAK